LGAEGGWGLWWCLWWGLGARVGGQGSDVVMEFVSAAPRPDGIQEAPPRNQIETSRGLRLLYVHESHAREPKPPLVGIERRKFGLKSPPGAIPNLGVSFQIFQTPKHFRADSSCGLASQPTCPDSALDRSVLRDLQVTQTGNLASNNLKGKKRTINT
jgi:hypothetical protein